MKKPTFDWNDQFETFLNELSNTDAAKLLSVIEKIEDYGLFVSKRQKWIKKIDENLFEIRVNSKSKALSALYFQKIDNKYFITHGFIKKTNKTPKKEILKAKRIRKKIGDKNE